MTEEAACAIGVRLFFFQAEDGIRDLVRSRGLGDVYKRQASALAAAGSMATAAAADWSSTTTGSPTETAGAASVSYTHLTLPTSDLV